MEQKNKWEMDTCCICLETIVIPVEPTCFQCRDNNNEISCFSMKRVCLLCLENFLELHKNRYERSIKKKCMFCPTTCNLHQCTKQKTFRADYLMMDKDERIISCPFENCPVRSSSHLKVARHVFQECPYYNIECECGHVCPRADMAEHYRGCEKYKTCEYCSKAVLESELPRHMYYDHDKTKCFTCHEYINMNSLSDHILTECQERLVTCEICSTFIRIKNFKNHLRRHIVEITKNVQSIRAKLREEENAYQHIQKLINDL